MHECIESTCTACIDTPARTGVRKIFSHVYIFSFIEPAWQAQNDQNTKGIFRIYAPVFCKWRCKLISHASWSTNDNRICTYTAQCAEAWLKETSQRRGRETYKILVSIGKEEFLEESRAKSIEYLLGGALRCQGALDLGGERINLLQCAHAHGLGICNAYRQQYGSP
jgi:hypothetical protein